MAASRSRRETSSKYARHQPPLLGEGEIKSEPDDDATGTEGETSHDSASRHSSSSMSLDVLAQVATETLEREPVKAKPKKKGARRGVNSLEMLTLEQIRMLSDSALINMFADSTSDELRRQFTYTCFLMPDHCKESFSSFGNESRARQRVKAHLLAHIGELLQDSNLVGRTRPKFVAEPVPARKKRLQIEKMAKRKQQAKGKKNAKTAQRSSNSSFTAMKERAVKPKAAKQGPSILPTKVRIISGSLHSPAASQLRSLTSGVEGVVQEQVTSVHAEETSSEEADSEIIVDTSSSQEQVVETTVATATAGPSDLDPEKQLEENEIFIRDFLARTQPYQDHSYTTIFGRRKGVENSHLGVDSEEEHELDDKPVSRTSGVRFKVHHPRFEPVSANALKTVTLRVNAGTVPTMNNVHIPIIRLSRVPVEPEGDPPVTTEAELYAPESDLQTEEMATSAHRPYPPMPKSEMARMGKVSIPEEECSSSDDEQAGQAPKQGRPLTMDMKMQRRSVPRGTAEWERKLALKCIRELRCKKKEDPYLICKICKDKTFTATATLMYHYRSHAGIKPFVCLICNTTFTRQHSLNYHMLIHNNQSRFTCKECGRKFRHPSHFKEHLRRHTGETPFHCTDCPLRFKTRNTYKRHLKTRHGKLLTAMGIQMMPSEEFMHSNTIIESDIIEEDSMDEMEEEEQKKNVAIPVSTVGEPNRLLEFCAQVVDQEIGQDVTYTNPV